MIIFDLDGTLTEISDQAAHCMGSTHTKQDILRVMDPVKISRLKPRKDIIDITRLESSVSTVVVITGRWDFLQEITQAWLRLHNVAYDFLLMRKHEAWREDSVEVKLSAWKAISEKLGETTTHWYDDDQKMLDALPANIKAVKV